MKKLCQVIGVGAAILLAGCQPTDGGASSRDVGCKLAYVFQMKIESPGKITDAMRSFVNSNAYEQVNDSKARDLLKQAFQSGREALAESDPMLAGKKLSRGIGNVIAVCEGKSEIAITELFGELKNLAKEGEKQWK